MRNVNVSRPLQRSRGFTLIELVIAIVVVAVLVSVALPAFFDSIRKSRRSEAFAALSALQQAQERWRANNSQYTTNLTGLPTDTPPGLGLAATTPTGYYTISIVSADPTSYEATAIANSGTSQAKDANCAKLGVMMGDTADPTKSSGNITYAGTGAAGSLSYGPTSSCWSR